VLTVRRIQDSHCSRAFSHSGFCFVDRYLLWCRLAVWDWRPGTLVAPVHRTVWTPCIRHWSLVISQMEWCTVITRHSVGGVHAYRGRCQNVWVGQICSPERIYTFYAITYTLQPIQPPTLYDTGNEYRPKFGNALRLENQR